MKTRAPRRRVADEAVGLFLRIEPMPPDEDGRSDWAPIVVLGIFDVVLGIAAWVIWTG